MAWRRRQKKVVVLNTGGTFSQVAIGYRQEEGTDFVPARRRFLRDEEKELEINPGFFEFLKKNVVRLSRAYFDPNVVQVEHIFINDSYFAQDQTVWPHNSTPACLDSSSMNPVHWNVLAKAIWKCKRDKEKKVDAIVVIHGTDSLAFSAAAISFMVLDRSFPIVFTGSQYPLLYHEGTDAIPNLIGAIAVASKEQFGKLLFRGVHVVFNGKLMQGVHVVKVSSTDVDAFHAPRFAPVGSVNYTEVQEDPSYIWKLPPPINIADKVHKATINRKVLIIKVYPGIDLRYLDHFAVPRSTRNLNFERNRYSRAIVVDGIVILGLGSGNGPVENEELFMGPLKRKIEECCFVSVCSDCLDGRALATYATSLPEKLGREKVACVDNMTAEATYAKMMVILGNNLIHHDLLGVRDFKERMEKCWVGEILGSGDEH